jgi:hypothetical protein
MGCTQTSLRDAKLRVHKQRERTPEFLAFRMRESNEQTSTYARKSVPHKQAVQ